MKPADLVRYSFEALEAWAGERACGRAKEETPTEFTERLACEVGELDSETLQLGNLYGCVLYADGTLPSNWRGTVEQFWQHLPSGEREVKRGNGIYQIPAALAPQIFFFMKSAGK